MPVLLAIASSLSYGVADFLAGMASRRSGVLGVVVLSQLVGLVGLALVMLALPAPVPTRADLWWGVAAGVSGGAGVLLFYGALASGRMSVVAPVTAVCGLTLPVVVGLALGERPPATALAGVVLALAAVVLLGGSEGAPDDDAGTDGGRTPVAEAVAAGVLIGVFYLALSRTTPAAGLAPVLVGRMVSVSGLAIVGAGRGRGAELRVPRGQGATVAAAGLVDTLANALYQLAVRGGLVSVITPLASLYPASTVLLARVVLGERLGRAHAAGLAVAAAAVLLMAV